jgi:large conductance mechanosensitive channel
VFKGFRDFLLRGNVIDLAVAVVIGTAFVALIGAFTVAFIDPLIRLVLPGDGVEAGVLTIGGERFDFTLMVNALITFGVTAAAVYFVIVVPAKRYSAQFAAPAEDSGPTEVELLTEIRDALRNANQG